MAAIAGTTHSLLRTPFTLSAALPRFFAAPASLKNQRTWSLFATQIARPLLPSLSLGLPVTRWNMPSWLEDIWESVLRAVPKKKTSHSKKRSRQMAGKALEDVMAICKCPGCGQPKRKHVLCPHCANQIKGMWHRDNPSGKFV